MERVLNVFEFTKLARPAAIEQLASRMQGYTLIVDEDGNLLEAGFEVLAYTLDVAKEGKGIPEGGKRFRPGYAGRPKAFFGLRHWPPPLPSIAGRPGDAVVALGPRTGNDVATAGQIGKRLFQQVHPRYPLS